MIDSKIESCIADYCRRTISHRDFMVLSEWLAADPSNRKTLVDCLRAYRRGRELALPDTMGGRDAWLEISKRLHRPRRRLYIAAAAAAAAVILAVCLPMLTPQKEHIVYPGTSVAILELPDGRTIPLAPEQSDTPITDRAPAETYPTADSEPALHSVYVPVGGEYAMLLPDGTRVHLNSDSRLRFPTRFSADVREVWVEGEAWLEVTPDPGRRFVVNTADATIEVLGTSFNVSAYPSDGATATTLISGKVSVTATAGGQRAEIVPGQQAVVSNGGIEVGEVIAANYVSWTSGTFEFENMALGEICARLSRWYDVEFEFSDPALAERRFTGGTWKYVALEDFLHTVEMTTDISFRIRGDRVAISGSKQPAL